MFLQRLLFAALLSLIVPATAPAGNPEPLPMPRIKAGLVSPKIDGPQPKPAAKVGLSKSEATVYGVNLVFDGTLQNLKGRKCTFIAWLCDENGEPLNSNVQQHIICKLPVAPPTDLLTHQLAIAVHPGQIADLYGAGTKTAYLKYVTYDEETNRDLHPVQMAPIALRTKPRPPLANQD